MTVSDDERREVARRLREPYTLFRSLPEAFGFTGQVSIYELRYRLADLIEPEPERTCRPHVWCDGLEECHGVYERWIAECESCGATLGESFSDEQVRSFLPNYCPNCGAKVVK